MYKKLIITGVFILASVCPYIYVRSSVDGEVQAIAYTNTDSLDEPKEVFAIAAPSKNLTLRDRFSRAASTLEIEKELSDLLSIIDRWNETRGFFTEAELSSYASYNEDTLMHLVKIGDLKAIVVLSKSLEALKRFADARLVCVEGAVRGSVSSMAQLVGISGKLAGQAKQQGDEAMFKKYLIEMVAWDRIAKDFGSTAWADNYIGSGVVPKIDHPLLRSPEDQKQIESAVIDLKIMMENTRTSNGLGPADSYIPNREWQRIKEIDLNYYNAKYGRFDERTMSALDALR